MTAVKTYALVLIAWGIVVFAYELILWRGVARMVTDAAEARRVEARRTRASREIPYRLVQSHTDPIAWADAKACICATNEIAWFGSPFEGCPAAIHNRLQLGDHVAETYERVIDHGLSMTEVQCLVLFPPTLVEFQAVELP